MAQRFSFREVSLGCRDSFYYCTSTLVLSLATFQSLLHLNDLSQGSLHISFSTHTLLAHSNPDTLDDISELAPAMLVSKLLSGSALFLIAASYTFPALESNFLVFSMAFRLRSYLHGLWWLAQALWTLRSDTHPLFMAPG